MKQQNSNYQTKKPKLLLHTCCAPCLTSVEEKLRDKYDITAYWFNPNIEPIAEYHLRLSEFEKYCKAKRIKYLIEKNVFLANWKKDVDHNIRDGEGKIRCQKCIYFRLCQSAKVATENNYDLFATTLSVSPHKNSTAINSIGEELSRSMQINFLTADFKKQNGYLRSIELSKKYYLYRQKYCGCLANHVCSV